MRPIAAVQLDKRLRFEVKAADDSFDSAGSEGWQPFDTVWGQVQDELSSRADRRGEGMVLGERRARVTVRWRPDLTGAMRIAVVREQADGSTIVERTLRIDSSPAEIGRRKWLEMTAVEWSTAGEG